MKIAIDARYLEHNGGISEYIKGIVIYGSKHHELVCISSKSLNDLPENVENIVLAKKYHWFFWEQIQLPFALYKLKPDIYHAPGNYGIPIMSSIPSVVTVQDIIPLQITDYFVKSRMPFISRLSYWLRMQVAFIFAQKIIVTNKSTIGELKLKFYLNLNKLKIIPLGISDFYVPITSKYTNTLLKKNHINRPYILNHGGLDRRKNIDKLIKAFAEIKKINNKEFRDILLVVTGENILLKNQLIKLAIQFKIEKWVKFIGYLPDEDIIALVKSARLVIYISKIEGFGLPPLEAMACKVPVIASDIPIIREHCKDIPIYVNPNKTSSVFYGLREGLFNNRAKETLERGEKISKEYSWGKTVKQTFNLYSMLIQ